MQWNRSMDCVLHCHIAFMYGGNKNLIFESQEEQTGLVKC